jgi:hypothetical protein
MARLEDVQDICAELPEVTVGERWHNRTWSVGGNGFAWERPFSKADIKRFGASTPPDGPILAVRVADLAEKEAVLATSSPAVFNIKHFDGYPAVLIQLNRIDRAELRELIVDGWFACAPSHITAAYNPA